MFVSQTQYAIEEIMRLRHQTAELSRLKVPQNLQIKSAAWNMPKPRDACMF